MAFIAWLFYGDVCEIEAVYFAHWRVAFVELFAHSWILEGLGADIVKGFSGTVGP